MNIEEAYNSIKKFNTISGTLDNPSYNEVDLYNSLGFEELSESIIALEENNAVEILDGALDEFYIICGKLQILEKMGYNVQEGLKRVCDNNLTKFPPQEKGPYLLPDNTYTQDVNEEYKVIVLKNKVGKIMKPSGFRPVDLSDCVPGESS